MIKIILSIILLGFTVFSYAEEEKLVGFEQTNIPELNEQIRALDIDNQIQSDGKLDLNSKKIENLATPTASTDASTKGYVDTAITTVQPLDAQLTDVAGLTPTDNGVIIGNGTNFVVESGATLKTSLGLTIGTNVQAYDAQLDDLADGTLSGAGTVDTAALTGTTYLPDATVDTTALKTATSEVSTTTGGENLTFTGGQYCHYPQLKGSTYNWCAFASGNDLGGTYVTPIVISARSGTVYAITLYHTASGKDYWLWLLVDKTTKDILSMSGAPDHPAYGNSNDFDKLPHPFPSYDSNTQDIILVEKTMAKEIQILAEQQNVSVLELVDKFWKIDFDKTYPYVPIHSGQFSPEHEPVLVKNIPDYIQVRRLTFMTDKDKSDKKKRQEDRQAVYEAEKITKENKIKAIQEKLKLTDEEFKLIKGDL